VVLRYHALAPRTGVGGVELRYLRTLFCPLTSANLPESMPSKTFCRRYSFLTRALGTFWKLQWWSIRTSLGLVWHSEERRIVSWHQPRHNDSGIDGKAQTEISAANGLLPRYGIDGGMVSTRGIQLSVTWREAVVEGQRRQEEQRQSDIDVRQQHEWHWSTGTELKPSYPPSKQIRQLENGHAGWLNHLVLAVFACA